MELKVVVHLESVPVAKAVVVNAAQQSAVIVDAPLTVKQRRLDVHARQMETTQAYMSIDNGAASDSSCAGYCRPTGCVVSETMIIRHVSFMRICDCHIFRIFQQCAHITHFFFAQIGIFEGKFVFLLPSRQCIIGNALLHCSCCFQSDGHKASHARLKQQQGAE